MQFQHTLAIYIYISKSFNIAMQRKPLLLITIILVLFALVLFGCTQPPVCGNNICEATETQYTCSQDCGNPPVDTGMLSVQVNDINTGFGISGALVQIAENDSSQGCGYNLAYPILDSANTDQTGFIDFKLEADKEYVVMPSAEDYELSGNYQCTKVIAGDNVGIKFDLNPLPPKPQCADAPAGTQILSIGDTLTVKGVGDYAGQLMPIQLNNYVQTTQGCMSPNIDWQKCFQAKWLLSNDTNVALKYVQKAPPYNLKDEFGSQYFNQTINYLSNCWIGNSLPYAVVSVPAEIEIRSNEVFPYDSTNTLNPQWKATISSNETAITGITIKNNWAHNQNKTETSNSKFMLDTSDSISMPLNGLKLNYNGIVGVIPFSATIGGDELIITDTRGVQRTIPLVISLSTGTNTFTISGSTYIADINTQNGLVRYWVRSTSSVAEPWNNPTGVKDIDYFDRAYDDKSVNVVSNISFIIDNDWGNARYNIAADKTTGQYWLLLRGKQYFNLKDGNIYFDGTYMPPNNYYSYYLPDNSTFDVLKNVGYPHMPTSGDAYAYTGVFEFTDRSTLTEYTKAWIQIDNSTGFLINTTDGKIRYPTNRTEVLNNYFILDEYTTSAANKLKQGYTQYGSKLVVDNGVLNIFVPPQELFTQTKLYSNATGLLEYAVNRINTDYDDYDNFNKNINYPDGAVENYSLVSRTVLQTIADARSPGEIVLLINSSDLSYTITFAMPVPFGTNLNNTITLFGKKYKVKEATSTKLVIEEV